MPKLKPNDLVIKSAIKGPRGQHTVDKHPGLYLFARGDGNASWRVKYRPRRGANQRWFTISDDAVNSDLGDVFIRATAVLSDLKTKGVDPQEERAQREREIEAVEVEKAKVKEVVSRMLQTTMTAWLAWPGRKKNLSARTQEEYARIFRLHVMPYFAAKPIAEITVDQIKGALEKVRVATSKGEGERGLQANKARTLLMSLFKYARKQGWITENIVERTDDPVPDANPDGKQNKPLSNADLTAVWNGSTAHMGSQSARVLKVAILLGRRASELVLAERHELDLQESTLFIPATREGNKGKVDDIVQLPNAALAILKDALAEGDATQSTFSEAPTQTRFVFRATKKREDGPTSRHTPSQEFRSMCDDLGIAEDTRFHDARGLVNDHMARIGVPQEIRSRTLHHTGDIKSAMVNSTYSTYGFEHERRRALTLWESRLLAIVNGVPVPPERW